MTPSTPICWALGIGLAWAVFVFFVPVDRWLLEFLNRRRKRLKELEDRVTAIEHKLEATPRD